MSEEGGNGGPAGSAIAPAPKFKQGDIVELRSGGPAMTVYCCTGNVACEWFFNGEVRRGNFAPSQLALLESFVVPVTHFRRAIQ